MRLVILLCFMFLVTLFGIDRKSFFKDIKSEEFIAIGYDDYQKGYQYFLDILKNKDTNNLNFEIEKYNEYIIIKDKNKKGFGAYIIKNSGKHFLQMPHCRYDRYTCSIGWKIFFENNFNGVAFSTAHRYNNQFSDMAHTKYNYFTAITKAFTEFKPKELIIQIHGFGKSNIKDTDIIVSSGSKNPSKYAKDINICLNDIGFKSKLYGKDIYTLGATTNSSNKLLKSMGKNKFIHLELSLDTRKKLLKSKKIRKRVAKCLK